MKYVGSKNKYAKYILPIILKNREENQWYVEPFCGGCNMIDKVNGNRLANDINFYLIEMWKSLVNDGWTPPDIITEEQYNDIKTNMSNYEPNLVGFVGFCCSYSGKWWGGYARGNNEKGKQRNYCLESKNNILNQIPSLSGVKFHNKSYLDLPVPNNSIIYIDPPYKGVLGYKDKIDFDEFWEWVRKKSDLRNRVFVSEYNAPSDFKCIWSKKVNNTLDKNTGSKQGIERLFIPEEQFIYSNNQADITDLV